MQYLGKILPVDGYIVRLEGSLPSDYTQSLTHLYQPLLGIEAIGLYQLLLHEIQIQSEIRIQTHHTLMNYMNLPLNRIYEARRKLEAIGLLQTYKHDTEEKVYYTYCLQVPFTPTHFFQDSMLSELLYRHVGRSKFMTLRNYYGKIAKQQDGTNITASFNDVFQTFKPKHVDTAAPLVDETATEIPLRTIDFTNLEQALKRKMIPSEKVLTETNKRIITQFVTLYGLETYEMEDAINWALTDENELDVEQLKAACHDLFQAKYNVTDVKLSVKKPAQKVKVTKNEPPIASLSKTDKLAERFERITPKELLEDFSPGNNASEKDLKIIGDLMVRHHIPEAVMNVAIHYVFLQSDMRLSKEYLETIVTHWARKNFKTAKEAMDYANERVEKAQKPRKNYQSKRKSTEIIPDWFKERNNKQTEQPVSKETTSMTKKETAEQEELVALLQRHASKNN